MKPRVVMHNSVSLDGRITGFMPDMGLHYGLLGTWSPDAHLAGSDTILAMPEEIPEETPEDLETPQEKEEGGGGNILVIPDSRGRVRCWHFLKRQPFWSRFVALVSESTPEDYVEYLEKRNVEYIRTGDDRVDMSKALEALKRDFGVETVLLDSGGTLNGVFLGQGLVDEISVLVHPVVVGGYDPLTLFKGELKGLQLELLSAEEKDGGVIWLRYKVLTGGPVPINGS